MAESKLRELSIDLYNRCGTIRRILVASINTAKENLQKEKINSKSQTQYFRIIGLPRLTPNLITGNIRL